MVSVCREGLVLFSTGEKGYASFFSRILKTANPMREDCIDIMLIWEFKNVRFSKYGAVTGVLPIPLFPHRTGISDELQLIGLGTLTLQSKVHIGEANQSANKQSNDGCSRRELRRICSPLKKLLGFYPSPIARRLQMRPFFISSSFLISSPSLISSS